MQDKIKVQRNSIGCRPVGGLEPPVGSAAAHKYKIHHVLIGLEIITNYTGL